MGVEKLRENGVSEILLIPYSHHDYEWCCTRAWHKWRYIRIFCDALAGVGLRFHPERGSVEVPFGAFKIVTLEWT